MEGESELEMARRHIREGKARVKRQREIVVQLQEMGASSKIATALLDQFQDCLRQHQQHLSRLEGGISASGAEN